MNEQRKKIVIAEIKYWKQSKLLPDHYCDFLLTLYSGGEDEEDVTANDSMNEQAKASVWKRLFGVSVIGIVLLVAMFLMTSAPLVPTLATISFAVVLFFGAKWLSREAYDARPVAWTIGSFLLLGASLHAWDVYFHDSLYVLIGFLVLNCLLWLSLGRRTKLLYFTISGFAGLGLIAIFLLL